jgi:transposase
MAANHGRQVIPTKLTVAQFEQFVLPHLSWGRRGPPPTLPLQKMFNYVLKALYMGCQWKMLPIETDAEGRPEIHHTRVYRTMRRWQADGSIDRVFAGSVSQLHDDQLLDLEVIHGDGTTTAAKKGGDNLGYSGHKHLKGDKVVAFCDRHCNIISLDGVYDCRENRKAIFNRGMTPNIPENPRGRKTPKRGRRRRFDSAIFEERFRTIERVFAWEDTFRRLLLRFERISEVHYALKTLAYTMINLRHYC